MSPRKRGLGRGLDALLATQAQSQQQEPNQGESANAELIADNKKSASKLNWKLKKNSLEAIISTAIKYHKNAL